MIEAVETSREGDETVWEVRRDARAIGMATTHVRRGGLLVKRLAVPESDAVETLDALLTALAGRGSSVAVDVEVDDHVLTTAVAGRGLPVAATQMRLDLALRVELPPRVTLRPMTTDEFVGYREHLVTAYAEDILGLGSLPDLDAALVASEQSTAELLPEGVDTPGQHLWTAYDGDVKVGILWIAVDGANAYIYDIEVREEQRRRGYGRELLDAGAHAARDLGADALGLNVFGHNDAARALYERAGYVTTERTYRVEL